MVTNLNLGAVAYLVRDYDEAIQWFTQKLGFILREDTPLENGKRWVRIAVPGGSSLLLAKASSTEQQAQIGHAAGGRVAFFLYTDDFNAAHQMMLNSGVRFRENPRSEPYGTVAVFEDLYGNGWDLIQQIGPQ
jgi:catechol 2,3-dioxygenase-like lactoylglutathione lyase family enzyme